MARRRADVKAPRCHPGVAGSAPCRYPGARMELASVESILGGLATAGARFLVVGGLAVVAHGYVRFTADVDLVLDLSPDNVRVAVAALAALDYRPRVPVPLAAFA